MLIQNSKLFAIFFYKILFNVLLKNELISFILIGHNLKNRNQQNRFPNKTPAEDIMHEYYQLKQNKQKFEK